MAQSKRDITAIPTVYAGIQLKSRFEAQAALLFDRLGWKWEYEPQSYMLPSGVNYMPDFFIPHLSMFVETRGVWEDKWLLDWMDNAPKSVKYGPLDTHGWHRWARAAKRSARP